MAVSVSSFSSFILDQMQGGPRPSCDSNGGSASYRTQEQEDRGGGALMKSLLSCSSDFLPGLLPLEARESAHV